MRLNEYEGVVTRESSNQCGIEMKDTSTISQNESHICRSQPRSQLNLYDVLIAACTCKRSNDWSGSIKAFHAVEMI